MSANLALGAESNLFKDGQVFLWDDTVGNTSLGRDALASVSGNATYNTAVGRQALQYTTTGSEFSCQGSTNTAIGDRALQYNTTGSNNAASGFYALRSNTTGHFNTATGISALQSNTTGTYNTALGEAAGYNTTGSSNILINNEGLGGESNVLRIGQDSGTGSSELDRAFIHGIRGRTTGQVDAITVMIDSDGQLGTVSSTLRVKQDIPALRPGTSSEEIRPADAPRRSCAGAREPDARPRTPAPC